MRGAAVSLVFMLVIVTLAPVAHASSWAQQSTPTSATLRAVDFWDEDQGLAVGTGHTVLRTQDGGASWEETDGGWFGFGWYDVAWESQSTAYAVGANAIFQPTVAYSTNGGVSWNWENFYINNNEGTIHGVAVSATHVLLAATTWNGEGVVLQKPIAAPPLLAQWTLALTVGHPIVGIDADGPLALAVGPDGTAYVSITGGLSWTPSVTGADASLYDAAVSFPDLLATGEDGTIVHSGDLGSTWTLADPPTDTRLRSIALAADGTAVAAGDDGTVLTASAPGGPWVLEDVPTQAALWGAEAVVSATGPTLWAAGQGGTVVAHAH